MAVRLITDGNEAVSLTRWWQFTFRKIPGTHFFRCCEFGIEPSGSMKCWETIEWPNV
jgi:hypothetical protein